MVMLRTQLDKYDQLQDYGLPEDTAEHMDQDAHTVGDKAPQAAQPRMAASAGPSAAVAAAVADKTPAAGINPTGKRV